MYKFEFGSDRRFSKMHTSIAYQQAGKEKGEPSAKERERERQ
jgi:hypothetical protein